MGLPRFLSLRFLTLCLLTVAAAFPLLGRDKKDAVQYGAGFIVNVPSPEADVVKAVEEVTQNGMIRGTKEYSKDEYLSGATVASDSNLFPAWTEGGKVFYKVRLHALDPRNFKDTNDVGTVAVRYIVMGQDEKHTVLRIDAIFVEDFKHAVHASDGSVETGEYKDIHDHIESVDAMRQQAADAEREKQEAAQKKFVDSTASVPDTPPRPAADTPVDTPVDTPPPSVSATSSIQDLEQRLNSLRKQTQRKVKSPGAPLKSAPFHTAGNLQSLTAGTEVLIVISTPYWFGVETHDGQHGWMMRDELEEVP
jgi:hypothetical protein